MDVRDLAPSLLALGDLFTTASTLLYPDRDPVALSIKATEEGSFEVELLLQGAGLWDQLTGLFSGEDATALVNLQALLLGTGGFFWAIKKIKNRLFRSKDVRPGWVRLTFEDGKSIDLPAEVLKLYFDDNARKDARDFVEPLARDGIERISFRMKDIEPTSVDTSEIGTYRVAPLQSEVVSDVTAPTVLTIHSVVFRDGDKWKFTDGGGAFSAPIADEVFRARVESGIEAFRSGDMLRCEMRTVQTRRGNVLYKEREIVRVVRHIPRGVQLSLSPTLRAIDEPQQNGPSGEPRQIGSGGEPPQIGPGGEGADEPTETS